MYKLGDFILTQLPNSTGVPCVHVNGLQFNIRSLNVAEYIHIARVVERLQLGRSRWAHPSTDENDLFNYDRLVKCVLGGCEIAEDANGCKYIAQPTFGTSLHAWMLIIGRSLPAVGTYAHMQEKQAHAWIRHVVTLVAFCHRLGILIRTISMREFIAYQSPSTLIALASPLSLHVCENWDDDRVYNSTGHVRFVAPEVLSIPTTYAGAPADMWAVGVLLYVMLFGRYPFCAGTTEELVDQITNVKFDYIASDASMDARMVIQALLDKNPIKRPTAQSLFCTLWMQKGSVERIQTRIDKLTK